MTDTPLKPEPVAWRYRERGMTLWNHDAKHPPIDEHGLPDMERQPLFTQDQLDAAVRAERERCERRACDPEKTYGSTFGADYLLAYMKGRQDAAAAIREAD